MMDEQAGLATLEARTNEAGRWLQIGNGAADPGERTAAALMGLLALAVGVSEAMIEEERA